MEVIIRKRRKVVYSSDSHYLDSNLGPSLVEILNFVAVPGDQVTITLVINRGGSK